MLKPTNLLTVGFFWVSNIEVRDSDQAEFAMPIHWVHSSAQARDLGYATMQCEGFGQEDFRVQKKNPQGS